ncbi:MAG: cell division protein ZapA [Gemmatimonadota bacterium]
MSEEKESRAVRVTVFGEEYVLRTELGERYTRSCAEHVDQAIQEAHIRGHVSEPHKAAILGALKITDELFRIRQEREALESEIEARLSALVRRVEAELGESVS